MRICNGMIAMDARFMISKLDMADRILSLTTIGTPHRGSPIADLVGAAAPPGSNQLVKSSGIDITGMADWTPTACARSDQHVPASPKVRYSSIAGSFVSPPALGLPVS